MSNRLIAILGLAGFCLVLLANSILIVDQRETVVIRQFGQFKREVAEPGLTLKLPLIQEALRFDRRVLALDMPAQEFLVSQLQVVIDPFARYQIVSPREFLRTVGSEDVLRTRLEPTINSAVRNVVSRYRFEDLLSSRRDAVMEEVRQQVDKSVAEAGYGIKIVDVRIRRADFPDQVSQAVFNRMRTERQTIAAEIRGNGNAEAQSIQARADADKVTLLAEATRDSQKLRGDGDSESIRLMAEATGKDANFYAFYRSLQAYREALQPDSTTLVLSPDSPFLRFFGKMPEAR